MLPSNHAISYFARRFAVNNIIEIGASADINSLISENMKVIELDEISKVKNYEINQNSEDTLIVISDVSNIDDKKEILHFLNDAMSKVRAIISTADDIRLVSPQEGWVHSNKANIYKPFGLDLGFSLFDAKLPTTIPKDADIEYIPLLACYNEVDIIEAHIDALLKDGAKPIVIDNWSNDSTYEALKKYIDNKKITAELYPASGPSKTYDWRELLARKEQIAAQADYGWIVHIDADEIRCGAFPELSMKQNLWLASHYGANAIDFSVINFRPVNNHWKRGEDLEKCFEYFEFGESRDDYTRQIKAWINDGNRASLAEQAGHEVRFAGREVFPYKFLLKHYPLRSDEHARRKLHKDRMPRFSKEERALGWHTHYDKTAEQQSFLRNKEDLIKWGSNDVKHIGASFVTGIPPVETTTDYGDAKPIIHPSVWLPVTSILVVDIPSHPVKAKAAKLGLSQLCNLIKTGFESVKLLVTNERGIDFAQKTGFQYELLDSSKYVDGNSPTAISIAIANYLIEKSPQLVFGIELGGALSKSAVLKSQGLALSKTIISCLATSPTALIMEDLGISLYEPIDFEIDYLEKLCIERCDEIITFSKNTQTYWETQNIEKGIIRLITPYALERSEMPCKPTTRIDQIVWAGPIAGRDLELFAICLKQIANNCPGIPINFIGDFFTVFGEHSGGYLVRTASELSLNINIIKDQDTSKIIERFGSSSTLFIVPRMGGAQTCIISDLLSKNLKCLTIGDDHSIEHPSLLQISEDRKTICSELISILSGSIISTKTAKPVVKFEELTSIEAWASGLFGKQMTSKPFLSLDSEKIEQPLVSVCIPHFDRVTDMVPCIEGFLSQTYKNMEIIIIDDGSKLKETKIALESIGNNLKTKNIRIVYQDNSYLGAARNTGFKNSKGEYILYFDDDDVPLPNMVENMVRAAKIRGADIVSANINFWENSIIPDNFDNIKCSSEFVGACPALAYWRNPFGTAAILVRRGAFEALGGYTTDYGIGWEDYEFAARACLKGYVYENIPLPLYLYRINYQGMASTTPTLANGNRIWKLFEDHSTHPELKRALKAGFYSRMYNEEKEAKWSWLHTLGPKTPLYHRLLTLPYNSWESNDLLGEIAKQEGDILLSERIRSALHDDKWGLLKNEVNSQSIANTPSTNRLFASSMALYKIGQIDAAKEIIENGLTQFPNDNRLLLLAKGRILFEAGQYIEANTIATNVLRAYPFDIEGLFLLYTTALYLSDEGVVKVARESLMAAIADNMISKYPDIKLHVPSEDSNAIIEYWAQNLAINGIKAVDFEVFDDALTDALKKEYHGWQTISPINTNFMVFAPEYGRVLEDNSTLFLHAPPKNNMFSIAAIKLNETKNISKIRAKINRDARANDIEVCVLTASDASILKKISQKTLDIKKLERSYGAVSSSFTTINNDGSDMLLSLDINNINSASIILFAIKLNKDARDNSYANCFVSDIKICFG